MNKGEGGQEIRVYQVGQFQLNTQEGTLLHDGSTVAITPKMFDVLKTLVVNAGHVVSKETLLRTVWADSFVEEGNLTVTIRQLRKALGDDAAAPTYIQTVSKRGYRLIAEVTPLDLAAAEPISSDSTPQTISRPEQAQPVRRTRSTAVYLVVGLMAVALATGVGYGVYRFAGARKDADGVKITRLTSNGRTKMSAVSPDGKFAAYVLEENRDQSLWLSNIANASNVQILEPVENVNIAGVTFSPDGNNIYYISNNTLYQIPIFGGASRKILDDVVGGMTAHGISFSPDGKQFAFKRYLTDINQSAIFVADAEGTNERMLVSVRRPLNFISAPAWSPDGKVIACSTSALSGSQEILAIQVSDGSYSRLNAPDWDYIPQLLWLPDSDGLLVVAAQKTLLEKIWRLYNPNGEAHTLTDDSNVYNSISLTADGNSLVTTRLEQEAHLWVMPGDDASQAKQLTFGFEKYDGILALNWLSRDRIIYDSKPNEQSQVWVIDADGSGSTQLSSGDYYFGASPDGNSFISQRLDAGGIGLFRTQTNDASRTRLTTTNDLWVDYSPDGKWVVFTRYAEEQVALWRMPAAGGNATKLTNVSGQPLMPEVSPDGKLVAFVWWKGGRRGFMPVEIGIVPIEGGDVIRSFNVPIQPSVTYGRESLQWTPDGKAINYLVLTNGISNIWRQPIDGGPPVQVTNFQTGRIFNFAYSPDGQKLVLSRGSFNRDAVLLDLR